jgi:pyruvate kinase
MPRTRIVATLGPATDQPGVLEELLNAGVDVARLNASHGTQADHRHRLEEVRRISRSLRRPVAVLLDLRGPKIRVGTLPPGGIELRSGDEFILSNTPDASGPGIAPVDYEPLPREVEKGILVLLDDGNIALRVLDTDGHDIRCEIERGGVLTSHKGINVPGAALSAPAFSDKDLEDVQFGLQYGVDYFALSFVRHARDVTDLRQHSGSAGIIAKIERPEALAEVDAILQASDGIMVARGDLGVEVPLEQVPDLQRQLLMAANNAGKPVITATQMLESMVENARPTRAEATDVHVAVVQLSDAVMLSAETAIGRYPVEAVRYMARIAAAAETSPDMIGHVRAMIDLANDATEAVAQAACEIAAELHAKAIVCSTSSGFTPRMVAKYRPAVPIVALASDERVRRRLALTWGVTPLTSPPIRSTDEMLGTASRLMVEAGLASPGDLVIITAGVPVGTPGHTNLIKVHRLGDPVTSGL